MYTLVNELYKNIEMEKSLRQTDKGLSEKSESFKLAISDTRYVNSQRKALRKRINRIHSEIVGISCISLISLLFLNVFIKRKLTNTISRMISIIPKLENYNRFSQCVFVSLICTLLTMAVYGNSIGGLLLFRKYSVFNSILAYSILMISLFPLLYFVTLKLFKIYGYKFILACYIAYFAKAISEFISMEDVDMEMMQSVDISIFGSELKNFLIEKQLENKVYAEKHKSDSLNAALVGWGIFERIEIYGDYTKLKKDEFESILLHEVGHSKDYSLLKKILVLFLMKILEMFIIVFLYTRVSPRYKDEDLGQKSSFMVLLLIYFLFMNTWMLMIHKLTSQNAEKNADLIAKQHNYGPHLSKVLYDITISTNTNLRTTFLYNSLKSYHPSIYSRIESLGVNNV